MNKEVRTIYGISYTSAPPLYKQKVSITIQALKANFIKTKYLAQMLSLSCLSPVKIIEYLLLFVLKSSFLSKVTLIKNPSIIAKCTVKNKQRMNDIIFLAVEKSTFEYCSNNNNNSSLNTKQKQVTNIVHLKLFFNLCKNELGQMFFPMNLKTTSITKIKNAKIIWNIIIGKQLWSKLAVLPAYMNLYGAYQDYSDITLSPNNNRLL